MGDKGKSKDKSKDKDKKAKRRERRGCGNVAGEAAVGAACPEAWLAGCEVALPAADAYAWAGPAPTIADGALVAYLRTLRLAVEERLSGHRLAHSLSVALSAGRLAAAHGVDPFLATAAGLLHDWDKRLSHEQQWAKAERYGVLEGVERDARMTPVLHGWTAAASLPETWDLPGEVFQAIARHTIGAPDMSDLDIVVNTADALEPLRGPEVDGLRALAAGELVPLFAACTRQSCLWVLESGRYLHPLAIEVWNAYEPYLPDALRI